MINLTRGIILQVRRGQNPTLQISDCTWRHGHKHADWVWTTAVRKTGSCDDWWLQVLRSKQARSTCLCLAEIRPAKEHSFAVILRCLFHCNVVKNGYPLYNLNTHSYATKRSTCDPKSPYEKQAILTSTTNGKKKKKLSLHCQWHQCILTMLLNTLNLIPRWANTAKSEQNKILFSNLKQPTNRPNRTLFLNCVPISCSF